MPFLLPLSERLTKRELELLLMAYLITAAPSTSGSIVKRFTQKKKAMRQELMRVRIVHTIASLDFLRIHGQITNLTMAGGVMILFQN